VYLEYATDAAGVGLYDCPWYYDHFEARPRRSRAPRRSLA
jgi:hypothetical protein